MAHYHLNEYKEAIVDFEEAYRAHPDPVFLYNVAQAYRANGDRENALRFYKNYLRAADNPPNRAEVESKIAELEQSLKDHPEPSKAPSTGTSTATASTPGTATQVSRAASPPRKRSWVVPVVIVGAVVVVGLGIGIGLGVGLGSGTHYPTTNFGELMPK